MRTILALDRILTNANSSVRTQAEILKTGSEEYTNAMQEYLLNNFPDEKLGNMSETDWRRAPGVFRVGICDYDLWRWNYENWSLNRKPSDQPRCSRFPCCPRPGGESSKQAKLPKEKLKSKKAGQKTGRPR